MAKVSFPMPHGRPWQVWLAFALSSAVLLAAMAWLTAHVWRIDHERCLARAEATLEQRVSLALWRMDTKLAPLIAEEVARPHPYYNSFISLDQPGAKGDAIPAVPSPLLLNCPENVVLNFDVSLDGQWKSPQVPPAAEHSLAVSNGVSLDAIQLKCEQLNELAEQVDVPKLLEKLPNQPLPAATIGSQQSRWQMQIENRSAASLPRPSAQSFLQNRMFADAPTRNDGGTGGMAAERQQSDGDAQRETRVEQLAQSLADADLEERNSRYQRAAEGEFTKQRAGNAVLLQNSGAGSATVIENASRPLWIDDQLLLARRVVRDGQVSVQGSWLDWPRLKEDLLAEARDLLPQADLLPMRDDDEPQPTRMLAGLPVQLVVGDMAASLAAADAGDAPLRWALGLGWSALIIAIAAVALLLWGVLALSERRAAFVSSVTHELRTPLTTFRMYAEMLTRDMVPTAERRRAYLMTLKAEADRLTHLVENVLAYSRLERGRKPQPNERTNPAALVTRFEPRLAERAAQAEMRFVGNVEDSAADASLATESGVVEQILFNLVDNAAKYAGRAADRRIELRVSRADNTVRFAVCDYGPGFVSLRDASSLGAFNKSAQQAAESAPGVGLGLALCRRLARELGGRLEIQLPSAGAMGACVVLSLPVDR